MIDPHYVWAASIVGGVVLTVFAPRLATMHIYLPPPKTALGRGATVVYGEAFAVIMVTYGLSGLMGNATVSATLNAVQVMCGFICLMAFIAAFWAEITGRVHRKEEL